MNFKSNYLWKYTASKSGRGFQVTILIDYLRFFLKINQLHRQVETSIGIFLAIRQDQPMGSSTDSSISMIILAARPDLKWSSRPVGYPGRPGSCWLSGRPGEEEHGPWVSTLEDGVEYDWIRMQGLPTLKERK